MPLATANETSNFFIYLFQFDANELKQGLKNDKCQLYFSNLYWISFSSMACPPKLNAV